jgi:predicted permease
MLDPILPLAVYLFLGYIYKALIQDNSKHLLDFVIYFALPSIVFKKIYHLTLDITILYLVIMFNVIIIANIYIAYIIGKALRLNKKTLATFIIVASFGNTSFIGFAYIDTFYGQDFVYYALIYDFFGSFLLLMSLGMMIITWGNGHKNSVKSVLKSIFMFPAIVVFILTVLLKNFDIPDFVLLTSESLGSTLVPVALIAIGMKFELKHIFAKLHIVSLALIIKMILLPIIVLGLFYSLYNINETWVKVTIIEVAMPPMTMAVVLAIKGGLDEKLAINSLVIGVIASLFSILAFTQFLA